MINFTYLGLFIGVVSFLASLLTTSEVEATDMVEELLATDTSLASDGSREVMTMSASILALRFSLDVDCAWKSKE